MQKIIVLGAGYAGLIAALRLAKKTRKDQAEITLVNANPNFVERIRLHQKATKQRLKERPIAKLVAGTGIRFIEGWVEAIRPSEHQVRVKTTDGLRALPYNKLVVALGTVVDRDAVPGVREHAYTLDQQAELQSRLEALGEKGGHLVVVGGGLTGIESATEIAEMYPSIDVTLVTGGTFGDPYPERSKRHLWKVFDQMGIEVRDHVRVQSITQDEVVTDRGRFTFDVCLWAGGFKPLTLAREAGLAVNERGHLLINEAMQSVSDADVFATGDAAIFAAETGIYMRMACATAGPMGAHTADNLVRQLNGKPLQPFSLGYLIHCVSLGRHNGLIQFVSLRDEPKDRYIGGRLAALIKEQVCRFAWWSVQVQRRRPWLYSWIKAPKPEQAVLETVQG